MHNLALNNCLPPTNDAGIQKVKRITELCLLQSQTDITTHHIIHGGMYSRTILLPKGTLLTGALIKIATILIISGDVLAYVGEDIIEYHGYNVLPGSAGRKQAFLAQEDTCMTMIFPTAVQTVQEAEQEFTDEAAMLFSRYNDNTIIITGE